ncbi:MAG TPA: hypothetical protein GXZ43_02775 [Clostridiaceae bacterium]|nr:hypothetical protein [Clostridiaceae bacterium]
MKPKKKINVGLLITIFLLLSIFVVYIILNSRVVLAKSDLQKQVESYQTIMTKALVVQPTEISQINSGQFSEQDFELLTEKIAENHWNEIQDQIENYYYNQDILHLHKRLFCDLLEKSLTDGTYLNNITNMNISDQTFHWNLKNQIKCTTLWEIGSDVKIRNNDQIISNYFFYVSSEIVWQQINDQWKIVKADPIFPQDFTYYEEEIY